MAVPAENSKPKMDKCFFSISTRRLAESAEGLNSSLGLSAGDLWPKKCEPICGLARSLKGFAYAVIEIRLKKLKVTIIDTSKAEHNIVNC